MILHIPHSSTNTLNYRLHNRDREILRMTDHFTDDLYAHKETIRVVFEVSRLVCDVERFEDDKQEYMSKFGMGVCYIKDTEGEKLRDLSSSEKEEILVNYYRPHHKKLADKVDEELGKKGSSLIIDCHSFPDEAYYFNSDFGAKRPDVCIGSDEFHTPKELEEKVKNFFLSKGYTVWVNRPYSGTMVPLKHYKKESRVNSIMIELNRKLYMDEEGFKTEHYCELKRELHEMLNLLN